MSISTTCRKVIIDKGVLSAECLKADKKTYVSSSIPLDSYIGSVDGNFTWGGKNFSQYAQDVGVIDGVLYAKLKTPGGKYVDAKFDLNQYITNNDGVLTAAAVGTTGVARAQAPPLEQTLSSASGVSAASAASMFSAASTTSTSATSVTSQTSTATKSSSVFRSSSFRSQSQQYLIEDTCSNYQLRDNCHFHVDYNHPDGRVSHSYIDLDKYICNENGQLQWGTGGFSRTCRNISLEGCFLIAECLVGGQKEHYVPCRFNLCDRLRISDGILIFIEIDKKLSVLLSEVPWMKFKVIAEPDLSVFGSHPVVQQTLIRIAESTVEHVTVEMHKALTIAMEAAIIAITASAIKHVSVLMETTVTDISAGLHARPSITEAECLRIEEFYGWGGHGGKHGGGYRRGGYSGGGRGGYSGGGRGGGYSGGGRGGYSGGGYSGGGRGEGYGEGEVYGPGRGRGEGYGGGERGGSYSGGEAYGPGGGRGEGYGGGEYGNGTYEGGENVYFNAPQGGPQGGVVRPPPPSGPQGGAVPPGKVEA